MWSTLFGLEARRVRLLKQCPEGPLYDYYQQTFPDKKSDVKHLTFSVLDFETTGLDTKKDHIISMGLVEIEKLSIDLNTSWHQIIKTKREMPQDTTIIHHITDDMVAAGMELNIAMRQLLGRLKGKVLIAHHATIELGFLNKVCLSLYKQEFLIPTIDTQILAGRLLQRQHQTIQQGSLRLFNLRNRYGLPVYKAHNALSDALATAELFLALLNELYPQHNGQLKDLLSRN